MGSSVIWGSKRGSKIEKVIKIGDVFQRAVILRCKKNSHEGSSVQRKKRVLYQFELGVKPFHFVVIQTHARTKTKAHTYWEITYFATRQPSSSPSRGLSVCLSICLTVYRETFAAAAVVQTANKEKETLQFSGCCFTLHSLILSCLWNDDEKSKKDRQLRWKGKILGRGCLAFCLLFGWLLGWHQLNQKRKKERCTKKPTLFAHHQIILLLLPTVSWKANIRKSSQGSFLLVHCFNKDKDVQLLNAINTRLLAQIQYSFLSL